EDQGNAAVALLVRDALQVEARHVADLLHDTALRAPLARQDVVQLADLRAPDRAGELAHAVVDAGYRLALVAAPVGAPGVVVHRRARHYVRVVAPQRAALARGDDLLMLEAETAGVPAPAAPVPAACAPATT